MSTPTFGNSAKQFTRAGIIGKWLLPIAPVGAVIGKNAVISDAVLGKAPGRFNDRKAVWSGLSGRYIVTGLTRDEFEEFQDWPTPNVGILGKAFPGIDSDASTIEGKLFVERVLSLAFGNDAQYAERVRGLGPRRLYAFKGYRPDDADFVTRTRHLTYKLKDGSEHKLDVIGLGGQYVATGIHPSGDRYEWEPDASLMDAGFVSGLTEVDNADIQRFIDTLEEELARTGGEILRNSGGGAGGVATDIRDLEPVMPVAAVMEGLGDLPNTPETFLHRDDFVSAVAAIRAALGKESLRRDVEDEIFRWATRDEDWCDEDYFDKVWKSLDKVRVPRDSLDRLFRRNGIRSHVAHNFDDEAPKLSAKIKDTKAVAHDDKSRLLDTLAQRYIFGRVSLRGNASKYTMRDRWDVDHDWATLDWWKAELSESDHGLINALQEFDAYTPSKVGLANFLRDLNAAHPEAFYSGEVKHPAYEKGEIFSEELPDGSIRRNVNMRFLSQAIRQARKPDPNPRRSQADVVHILDFVKRLFGPMAQYELDTLAYMAQTGDRPGHMLFLVGDSGVGKSLWMTMQATLFDGTGPEQSGVIDGSKIHNESARRFMLARVEGCRILSVRELPEGSSARDMASITSQLKQLVDPGPEGDWVMIEAKGQDQRPARNFARVIISSNYSNAIYVEQQDRRTFYVRAQITVDTKPDEDFYGRLVDITEDPARLAAFWRYLLTREIPDYSRYTAPPVSIDKAERIIAEMPNATARHMAAALAWFKASDREAFDVTELSERMTECAEAEYDNSNGDIDDRHDYTSKNEKNKADVAFMNSLRVSIKGVAKRLDREIRTSKTRVPAIYIMNKHDALHYDLMKMTKDEVLDFMDTQYDLGLPKHPMALYRKA